MKHCRDYIVVDWKSIVKYDDKSPTGLSYLESNAIAGRYSSNKAKEGGRIGWILNYKNKRWLVHRIIACLEMGGVNKNQVIDHLDGNPYNNTLENLRVTDQSTNLKNKRMQSNNTSGINGVGVYTNAYGNTYALATYKSRGVAKTRCFSAKEWGDLAVRKAQDWLESEQQNDGLFTERHGK